jgi:hypothetical protein
MLSHEIDHIVAQKHGGLTVEQNLAWACFECNGFKGTDLGSIDAESSRIVRLFSPRKDRWATHFRLDGGLIVPLTAIGRVTEHVLQFNLPELVQRRRFLIQAGRYPR